MLQTVNIKIRDMRNEFDGKLATVKNELSAQCNVIRGECKQAVCTHLDLLRQDYNSANQALRDLEEKQYEQALGFVAVSAQLDLLLAHANIVETHQIIDLKRRMKRSAANRMRRFTDNTELPEHGKMQLREVKEDGKD